VTRPTRTSQRECGVDDLPGTLPCRHAANTQLDYLCPNCGYGVRFMCTDHADIAKTAGATCQFCEQAGVRGVPIELIPTSEETQP
jgi:hypothetical protein